MAYTHLLPVSPASSRFIGRLLPPPSLSDPDVLPRPASDVLPPPASSRGLSDAYTFFYASFLSFCLVDQQVLFLWVN